MKTMFLISMMTVLFMPQPPPVQDSRPVILAFGDSLTSGYGVPRGSGYPEQLQKKLDAQGYKYRVVSMGVSGDTSGGGRDRMKGALAANTAIVILELGANTGLPGLTMTTTNAN